MVLSYLSDKLRLVSRVWVQREECAWPFREAGITEDFLPRSMMVNFMVLPSSFIDLIAYAKKYVNFWVCLNINGINVKQTRNGYVVFEHVLTKNDFGDYDFVTLKETLKDSTVLCIRRDLLFHHLSLSKK
jgi:hypothetical protein